MNDTSAFATGVISGLCVALCIFVIFFIAYKEDECNAKGGVRLKGSCVRVEIIK